MKHLAGNHHEPGVAGGLETEHPVAHDRETDGRKMAADLVRAASLDPDLEERCVLRRRFARDMRDCGLAFDTSHPRYVAAWQAAADAIIKTPAVVEINTGGIARGHVSEPYPSKEIIEYFKSHGKKMIFSSDCHNKDYLLCGYEEIQKYL